MYCTSITDKCCRWIANCMMNGMIIESALHTVYYKLFNPLIRKLINIKATTRPRLPQTARRKYIYKHVNTEERDTLHTALITLDGFGLQSIDSIPTSM